MEIFTTKFFKVKVLNRLGVTHVCDGRTYR